VKRRIAIIGGGISGLTAAYILQRDHAADCEFVLFEASPRLGGIIETVHRSGFIIECGPDSWVTEKPWAEELARELGLGTQLLPSNDRERRTYIARDAQLFAMPHAMRMMVPTDLDAVRTSSLFSERAKLAYLAEPARSDELRQTALLRRGSDADESVADFVRRHYGDEITRTVAGPLLAGVFGGDVEKLSARALLAPFVEIEAEYGSLILGLEKRKCRQQRAVFTTLIQGLQAIVDRLSTSLPQHCLRVSEPVLALCPHESEWSVKTCTGTRHFDRVLLATSLDPARQLLAASSLQVAQRAAAQLPTKATSSLIVALGYSTQRKPVPQLPPGFGFLVASSNESHSLLACTFVHQKFEHRAPSGASLLRCFFSSGAADELSNQSDEQIASIARTQLKALVGPLPTQADVTLVRRWPRSLPQYEVGHVARMRMFGECLASIPGIAVATNALSGVGLPDLIRNATGAAHTLAKH
jgi:protoporphyrinogen/coproporphyrinogen III oxidase